MSWPIVILFIVTILAVMAAIHQRKKMAIHNFDKTERYSQLDTVVDDRPDFYKMNPQHALFDPSSPDFGFAEATVLENLRIAGAWVTVLPRSDDEKFDKTWMEDQDPTYYAGHDFKAFMPPTPPEVLLTKFGQDAPITFDVTFSRAELLERFDKRLIRIGDVIVIPHNSLVVRARRFRVLHVGETGNFRYRWLFLNVTVQNINRDESFEPQNA